jgi:hypothetical protein
VYAAGGFASLDTPLPPAMPDWSPVRSFGGYAAWGERPGNALQRTGCGCANACDVHGHAHAWTKNIPVADLKDFWGALGCACWAV